MNQNIELANRNLYIRQIIKMNKKYMSNCMNLKNKKH